MQRGGSGSMPGMFSEQQEASVAGAKGAKERRRGGLREVMGPGTIGPPGH